jgi:hypothetical protein
MRRMRIGASTAIIIALSTVSLTGVHAEPTPSPSPSILTFKAAQEQYKKDRDAFMAAIRDREMKMRSINATFKAAVDKSALDAKAALATATTPEQKNAINSTRRAALAAAIVARESAIAALGAMPTPPVEPMRPSHTMMVPEQKGKQKR